ncbi:LAGLIDADG family homing endonuclease [Anaeromicropila populeti]|uniref:Prophage pi2 protein 38 n=1 Tax=Anaeromicropila populeti TaxID=37658 RepID=A0A1I6LRU7_9FIRM|nr:LAGLIDADG family homing endonuclease [Anaeromicropila populeti]SFS06010.1 hypothetical protein SAMN05661086_03504 [Anaeromicropila populeti]
MNHEEVMQMVEEMKLPSAYHHFVEGESPEPPFFVFSYAKTNPFAADGTLYYQRNRFKIELYTNRKSIKTEDQIETVLERYGIFYVKSEIWIASERLYEVLYEMEV